MSRCRATITSGSTLCTSFWGGGAGETLLFLLVRSMGEPERRRRPACGGLTAHTAAFVLAPARKNHAKLASRLSPPALSFPCLSQGPDGKEGARHEQAQRSERPGPLPPGTYYLKRRVCKKETIKSHHTLLFLGRTDPVDADKYCRRGSLFFRARAG